MINIALMESKKESYILADSNLNIAKLDASKRKFMELEVFSPEPLGASWSLLQPPRASWSPLEDLGASQSLLEPPLEYIELY